MDQDSTPQRDTGFRVVVEPPMPPPPAAQHSVDRLDLCRALASSQWWCACRLSGTQTPHGFHRGLEPKSHQASTEVYSVGH